MPARLKAQAFLPLLLTLAALAGCAHLPPQESSERPFHFETDRFAFANETVWNYVGGEIRPESERADAGKPRYSRHCFVVARGAVQFWKFARFEPNEKPLPPDQLAERIRQVAAHAVWSDPLPDDQRIVFPGYPNVREMSAANASIFEANMGAGWPIYFRPGNYPMIFPTPSGSEADYNQEILLDLAKGYPTILWLYNFPSLNMNHAVVVYAGGREGDHYLYRVYDPNYSEMPKHLTYDPAKRQFSYEATFYFKGGTVTARPLYRSPLQ